jgi:riboflavin kinase/FMN adenylyltransferase
MELIRGLHNIKPKHQGCVVTIGNFDGLHLGHQTLIKQLLVKSKTYNLPALVITFEPQPNEYFSPQEKVPRLMSFREKVEAVEALGIDRVLCIQFNEMIATQIAEVFVRKVLVEKLAAKYVLVGDDFHFGFKRMGNYSLLEQMGEKYHFATACMSTFEIDHQRVSSTRIRGLLEQGEVQQAIKLLGHAYRIKGRIAHGDKKGRILGFPTANILLQRREIPLRGVFAVEVMGIADHPLAGVANIGVRPTLTNASRRLLEVHLLDFNEDIYGKKITISILEKFRDEMRFNSFDELKGQIQIDVEHARTFHRSR